MDNMNTADKHQETPIENVNSTDKHQETFIENVNKADSSADAAPIQNVTEGNKSTEATPIQNVNEVRDAFTEANCPEKMNVRDQTEAATLVENMNVVDCSETTPMGIVAAENENEGDKQTPMAPENVNVVDKGKETPVKNVDVVEKGKETSVKNVNVVDKGKETFLKNVNVVDKRKETSVKNANMVDVIVTQSPDIETWRFLVGDVVELGYIQQEFASWHTGVVIEVDSDVNKRTVMMDDLFADDGITNLRETVYVGKTSISASGDRLRPQPPPSDGGMAWTKGTLVDVFLSDGWWEGKIEEAVLPTAPGQDVSEVRVWLPDENNVSTLSVNHVNLIRIGQRWDARTGIWNLRGFDPVVSTAGMNPKKRLREAFIEESNVLNKTSLMTGPGLTAWDKDMEKHVESTNAAYCGPAVQDEIHLQDKQVKVPPLSKDEKVSGGPKDKVGKTMATISNETPGTNILAMDNEEPFDSWFS